MSADFRAVSIRDLENAAPGQVFTERRCSDFGLTLGEYRTVHRVRRAKTVTDLRARMAALEERLRKTDELAGP